MLASLRTFIEENFDGRDFRNQCVVGVRFVRCSIRRADFTGADLSYSSFEDCDLYETKFVRAVLYTCRFNGCDATKSDFSDALLNGIRFKDTDITHSVFGPEFDVGKNRKWISKEQLAGKILQVKTFDPLGGPIRSVETAYDALYAEETGHAIQFIDDWPNEEWRKWRRRSEVAKTVERMFIENGYKDRSLDVYFMYRYYDSRADQRKLLRYARRLVLEWVWGYGVKLLRPMLAWVVVVLLFTIAYVFLPMWDSGAGLSVAGAPRPFFQDGRACWDCLIDAFLFSTQVSSLSVYGDVKPVGLAKPIALVQQIMSVVIVGLGVATITRRIGNI